MLLYARAIFEERRCPVKKTRYSKNGLVFLCALAYFASYFSRKTFSVVLANLLEDGIITDSIASLVASSLFVFYGLGQLVSGYLGDRLSPKYLMFSGLMISAVCNLFMPLVPNGYYMIPIWAINGFAQALLWPPIVRILSDNLNHEKYVTANLIVTCGAHISTIVLFLYAPICITFMSWRAVFFTSTVFCVLSGIVFLVLMSLILPKAPTCVDKTTVLTPTNTKCESIWKILTDSGVIPVFLAIVAMGFLRDGIETWLPTLYMQAFNQSSEGSILVSVALPVFSIISIFAVRAIHKRKLFNNESSGSIVLFLLSIIFIIPLCILINVNHPVSRIISLLLASITCACMHACNFLLIGCLPGRFAKTNRASSISGICNACTYIGAALSMFGISKISSLFGWSAAIGAWGGICLLGALACLLALRRYTKFLDC